ncbi:MAG: PEGA domain-containing protein [Deltaproteobacteria bacterium]
MLAAALLLALAQPDARPVVAVFPIQDSSGRLQADATTQLTDYLGVKIAESGGYIVVPRKDIEAALAAAKAESYQACYDQACQIEIGKELAAQKIVHTQIVQVGDQCAVTATLYDLRIAATDRATSEKGGCGDNELVASIEAVARKLAPSSEPAAPDPNAPKFGVKLTSEPSGAEVILDGRFVGKTPARLSVDAGRPHRLTLQYDGYVEHTEEVSLEKDEQRHVDLRLTRSSRANRDEWFGLSLAAAVTFGGAAGAGFWARIANLHFGDFAWTVVEGYLGVFSGPDYDLGCPLSELGPRGFCEGSSEHFGVFLGTRPGWTFSLEDSGEHALEVSVGGGLYAITSGNDESSAFAVTPSVRYLRRGDGAFVYGGGLRLILPVVTPDCDPSGSIDRYVGCRHGNPVTLQLEVPLGWYL